MSPESTRGLIVFLDATRGCAHLTQVCRSISGKTFVSLAILHDPGNREEVAAALAQTGRLSSQLICDDSSGSRIARALIEERRCATVAYVPCEMELDPTVLSSPKLLSDSGRVTPLLPAIRMEPQEDTTRTSGVSGWVAPAEVALQLLTAEPRVSGWSLPNLIAAIERSGRCWRWDSGRIATVGLEPGSPTRHPAMTARSRVLAVVPHYRCEEWLAQCLYSLTTQTRPPDNIVVVDDNSGAPPRDIVHRFAEVTLLSTPANIGPENILDEMIQTTGYDAYLVQDADDWSSEDRLEQSLQEAERTGAEIVGAQELRFPAGRSEIVLRTHPLDVNRAMSEKIAHYVCHATSLIARALALRVGGFDHTLQLVADTDFILRASHVGRIVNLPAFHYYRRMRASSRTSTLDTGFESTIRASEAEFIFQRASRNRESKEDSIATQVMALKRSAPIGFRHILGPLLTAAPRLATDRLRG